ncbi:hypothetical protein NADFUDRAFT_81107 [Nadsonia fulvescens var. elongata DSM 6958]|uniref:SWIRM-domain-containing protein n=1 Tax=Nadsonia fulvescens var. elongata DSM 6958 TaxID=857566 RepID=A0A1E3PRF4_9ASCO|nr:hypothetical protein NADFUDRAFT_81107 [Nadsonia fulvescens var. elongata DSM 6958]
MSEMASEIASDSSVLPVEADSMSDPNETIFSANETPTSTGADSPIPPQPESAQGALHQSLVGENTFSNKISQSFPESGFPSVTEVAESDTGSIKLGSNTALSETKKIAEPRVTGSIVCGSKDSEPIVGEPVSSGSIVTEPTVFEPKSTGSPNTVTSITRFETNKFSANSSENSETENIDSTAILPVITEAINPSESTSTIDTRFNAQTAPRHNSINVAPALNKKLLQEHDFDEQINTEQTSSIEPLNRIGSQEETKLKPIIETQETSVISVLEPVKESDIRKPVFNPDDSLSGQIHQRNMDGRPKYNSILISEQVSQSNSTNQFAKDLEIESIESEEQGSLLSEPRIFEKPFNAKAETSNEVVINSNLKGGNATINADTAEAVDLEKKVNRNISNVPVSPKRQVNPIKFPTVMHVDEEEKEVSSIKPDTEPYQVSKITISSEVDPSELTESNADEDILMKDTDDAEYYNTPVIKGGSLPTSTSVFALSPKNSDMVNGKANLEDEMMDDGKPKLEIDGSTKIESVVKHTVVAKDEDKSDTNKPEAVKSQPITPMIVNIPPVSALKPATVTLNGNSGVPVITTLAINDPDTNKEEHGLQGAAKTLAETTNEDYLPQMHAVIIPSYASWFEMSMVHELEKKSLPEFFNGRNRSKTAQIYQKYRNFMINTYRLNPNDYLTVTSCRRNLVGDVGSIMRTHAFLEKWGLINYQVDVESRPNGVEPPYTGHWMVTEDTPKGLFPFQPYKGIDHVFKRRKMSNGASNFKEVDSTQDNSTKYSAINKDDSKGIIGETRSGIESTQIRDNVEQANAQSSMSKPIEDKTVSEGGRSRTKAKNSFYDRPMTPAEAQTSPNWSKVELLKLLEGIEKFNNNWDMIASFVGTKTREQCVLKYVSLSFEDSHLSSSNEAMTSKLFELNRDNLPFAQTDNPVLSVVAFMAGLVDPRVVAAMSGRGIDEMNRLLKEKDAKIEKSLNDHISKVNQGENKGEEEKSNDTGDVKDKIEKGEEKMTKIETVEFPSVVSKDETVAEDQADAGVENSTTIPAEIDKEMTPKLSKELAEAKTEKADTNHMDIDKETSVFDEKTEKAENIKGKESDIDSQSINATDAAAVTLGSMAVRSHILSTYSERQIYSQLMDLNSLQLAKIDCKLEKFAQVESVQSMERQWIDKEREQLFLDRVSLNKKMNMVNELLAKAVSLVEESSQSGSNGSLVSDRAQVGLNTVSQASVTTDTGFQPIKQKLKDIFGEAHNLVRETPRISLLSDRLKMDKAVIAAQLSEEVSGNEQIKPISLEKPQTFATWSM